MKTPVFPKRAAERQSLIPKAGKQQFTAQGLLITNWVALTELNWGKNQSSSKNSRMLLGQSQDGLSTGQVT